MPGSELVDASVLRQNFRSSRLCEHVNVAVGDKEDEEPYKRGQKRLRFVSFPGVRLEGEGHAVRSGIGGRGGPDGSFEMEGAARTLAIPKELDTKWRRSISIRARVR